MTRWQAERTGTQAWREWGARTYGPGWTATKQRYWRSRWTPKRCFWCRRRQAGYRLGGGLQLNHLTYLFVRSHRLHGAGWTPLWTLLPLCDRCHRVETWLTRKARSLLGRGADRWAHLLVTLGGWVASRGAPVLAAWWAMTWVLAKL